MAMCTRVSADQVKWIRNQDLFPFYVLVAEAAVRANGCVQLSCNLACRSTFDFSAAEVTRLLPGC